MGDVDVRAAHPLDPGPRGGEDRDAPFTGGIDTTEVEWKDIELPVGYHMFQTFQCGKSGKKFWLDDLGEMHDETLPARLEAQLNQE